MDYTALKLEITTGPLATELAPYWAAEDDVSVTAILNRIDRPGGYVESRKVVSILAGRNLLGLILAASRFMKLPDGTACPFAVFTLCATVDAAIYGNINPPLQFQIPLLTPALAGLVGEGLITSADQTALLAALLADEIQVSRATQLGWPAVSPDDVSRARRS